MKRFNWIRRHKILGVVTAVMLLIGGLAAIIIASVTIIASNINRSATGPQIYSENDAVKYGQKLFAAHGSASDCMKINNVFPSYPPQYSLQWSCVITFAALAQDPTACELLMPSDYGMQCLADVNAARSKEAKADPLCYEQDGMMRCFDHDTGRLISEDRYDQIEDCKKYDKISLRDSCHLKRTMTISGANECNRIQDKLLRTIACPKIIAKKEKSEELCRQLPDPWESQECLTTLRLWQKYPEYRCRLIQDSDCK
jgi:hypothetical protein